MTLGAWMMLAAVCVSGAMSPGPSLLVVVRTTLRRGATAGVLLALSHALAVGVYAGLVVFGLAYLVTESPVLMQLLRVAGAGFLLYLAWGAWHSSTQSLLPTEDVAFAAVPAKKWQAVRDGFLTGLLNPKIMFWFLALFSQFVEPATQLGHKLGIVLLATGIDGLWYLVVVLVLGRVRRLKNGPEETGFAGWFGRYSIPINRCFALLLLIIAVRILL
jgi:threonine/homoserine/homoserine lactone efflux protein